MTREKIDQIMTLIEETFGEEVSSTPSESALGLESEVIGKEEFLKRMKEKLEKIPL